MTENEKEIGDHFSASTQPKTSLASLIPFFMGTRCILLLGASPVDHIHHHNCLDCENFARQNYQLNLDVRPKGQKGE